MSDFRSITPKTLRKVVSYLEELGVEFSGPCFNSMGEYAGLTSYDIDKILELRREEIELSESSDE